ncbi:MAG: hypothetical protein ACLRT4_12830 [Thomasclavelia sp.]
MDKDSIVYRDSNLEIKENILKFSNHVIQLSNIASVSISPMEKKKIPSDLFYVLIGSIVLLAFVPILGIIMIAVALVSIFKIISDNNSLGYYLKISLSSGENYYFDTTEKKFLVSIVDIIEKCFNNQNNSIFIDMKNSNIQYGDNNVNNVNQS